MKRIFLIFVFLSPTLSTADSDLESALSGCAAIKNAKQKAGCYDSVTKLAVQARPSVALQPAAATPKTSQHAEFIAKAKSDITRNFKDPSSVQWRNLFVSGDQMPVLCGELNGKNSYGAFVGFRRFYAAANTSLQEIEDAKHPAMMNGMWPSMCGNKVEDVGAAESVTPPPTAIDSAQKSKWITTMAQRNGCEGAINIKASSKDGAREKFQATCENKVLEFTCEFNGEISEAMGGIPFVSVTGKSYTTQPACWM
jgi:hypothetical protein